MLLRRQICHYATLLRSLLLIAERHALPPLAADADFAATAAYCLLLLLLLPAAAIVRCQNATTTPFSIIIFYFADAFA